MSPIVAGLVKTFAESGIHLNRVQIMGEWVVYFTAIGNSDIQCVVSGEVGRSYNLDRKLELEKNLSDRFGLVIVQASIEAFPDRAGGRQIEYVMRFAPGFVTDFGSASQQPREPEMLSSPTVQIPSEV